MKLVFLATLLLSSILPAASDVASIHDQGVGMQLSAELEFSKTVQVYDYEGGLIKQFKLDEVTNDDITISEHLFLEASDFAFSYQGDYYYLGNEADMTGIVN